MTSMHRELPVSERMARLALLDVVESCKRSEARQDKAGQYSFRIEVFGNLCGFKVSVIPCPGGCALTAELTEAGTGLTAKGEARTLRYLLDSVEQLMENEQLSYEKRRGDAAASEGV